MGRHHKSVTLTKDQWIFIKSILNEEMEECKEVLLSTDFDEWDLGERSKTEKFITPAG